MGRIYCEACGANWRSSGDGPEAQEHHVDVPCVGESTEFKQRAEIAALTEKLRAVEAERDDVCLMLVRSTSTKSTLTSIAIENLQHIARLERGEAEREAHLEAGARELSALRAELERKDAALKAAESFAHWSNEFIMHLEREFGPQPKSRPLPERRNEL